MRVSMGIAWMVIVAVEMLAGGGKGIGSYVWEQYNALKLAEMVAAIIIIGVVGFVLDARLPAPRARRRHRGGPAMSLRRRTRREELPARRGEPGRAPRGRPRGPPRRARRAHRPLRVRQVHPRARDRRAAPRRRRDASPSTASPVTAPGPDRAMVFQHYSLLPRLSLLDNVRHAVRAARPGWGRAKADAAAERYLAAVGLDEHLGKKPAQVSGGMQQRAAVARAFAVGAASAAARRAVRRARRARPGPGCRPSSSTCGAASPTPRSC